MKKYLFLAATTALALTSCVSDDYVGENPGGATGEVAISFGSKTATVTRAGGAEAAATLGNSFVVYGYKSYSPAQTVYDHYTVNFKDGSALSTESNSAGWEYVGQTLNKLSTLTGEQSIKYWDFAATSYDFIAFSLGQKSGAAAGTPAVTQLAADKAHNTYADGEVYIKPIDNTPTYEITGKIADIAKVYIADRVTAKPSVDAGLHTSATGRQVAYKNAVQFNFHSAVSKVRMGIYETIPGYSVKDVKFYAMGATDPALLAVGDQAPTLYGSAATIANSSDVVTATVTFPNTTVTSPDYNKAVLTLPDGAKSKNMTFSNLTLKGRDHKEAEETVYLGRESNTASMCDYVNVFPCNAGALTLKVDYTLLSRDGSGEEIKVVGATATVPEKFGDWKPNYAYTYLFKISDNTNGEIGGEVGLYPITFDAIVTENEDGVQETITSVATPSITTYAKGAVKDEYCGGDNIYVNVNGITVTDANLKLYKVTTTGTPVDPITEASVANALENGGITDINGGDIVVTAITTGTDVMTIVDAIAATDAPDGIAVPLTNKAGKFTATASTIYAVEYNAGGAPAVKHYKVIRVGATARP